MKFNFNEAEQVSVLNVAQQMMLADGKVTTSEQVALALEVNRLGIKDEDLERLIDYSQRLITTDALITISNFDIERKRYVRAFLTLIMCADGDIDNSEIKLLQFISGICNLPQMGMKEAIDYMKNLPS